MEAKVRKGQKGVGKRGSLAVSKPQGLVRKGDGNYCILIVSIG